MAFAEYAKYDGLGLAHLVRRGEVSPLELVEEAIARIERHNPKLNAIVFKAYDQARAAAKSKLPDGPFRGVPFLIKDIGMEVAGWPLTNGGAPLEDYLSQNAAQLTHPHPDAGAVLLCITNTPQCGVLALTG